MSIPFRFLNLLDLYICKGAHSACVLMNDCIKLGCYQSHVHLDSDILIQPIIQSGSANHLTIDLDICICHCRSPARSVAKGIIDFYYATSILYILIWTIT